LDQDCQLEDYFWSLKLNMVVSWDERYANVVHNFWHLVNYLFYFVYGVVWTNYYDMAFAAGVFVRILTGVLLAF